MPRGDNLWLYHDDMFTCDAREFAELNQMLEEYPQKAGKIIDEVLHGEGAQEIMRNIRGILPASGRRWSGKKAPASSVQPFRQIDGPLFVTINSTKAYNYLYFPDDGSNTVKHAGQQHFMLRGAEKSKGKIIEACLGKLTEI